MSKLLYGDRLIRATGPLGHTVICHWCPACESLHQIQVAAPPNGGPVWDFDWDFERPTFHPSVRARSGPGMGHTCHYWLKAGRLEYCADSTHALAGRTEELPEMPAEWIPRSEEDGE